MHHPRTTAALAKVFLGDWHPILRDPVDVVRLSFFVGAVVFVPLGDPHGAAQLALTAVALLVARMADVPRLFDRALCIATVFDGWGGALHLFSHVWWYDDVVHINLPCFLGVLLYIAPSRLEVLPDPAQKGKSHKWLVGMGLITLWIGVTLASLCQSYEWVVDGRLGRHLLTGQTDTTTDAADGLLGSAIAGLLPAAWAAADLPTRRRPRPSPAFAWSTSRDNPASSGSPDAAIPRVQGADRQPAWVGSAAPDARVVPR
jgi:hypothetical protein